MLGTASEQEVAELQKLRLAYPAIAAAIAQCEDWLAEAMPRFAVPVAASRKEQLLSVLSNELQEPAPVTVAPAPVVGLRARYVAAASVILLLASAALNIYLYKKYTKAASDYSALQQQHSSLLATQSAFQARLAALQHNIQVMAAPGMLKVPMPGVPGKEQHLATVYWDTRSKAVYLLSSQLPPAPAGKQYQLWALVDGKPVDAGVLDNCDELCQLKPVQQAQAFAITLEKAGGSPLPDLSQLYVMGKVPS